MKCKGYGLFVGTCKNEIINEEVNLCPRCLQIRFKIIVKRFFENTTYKGSNKDVKGR